MMFLGSMSRPTLSRLSSVSAVATFLPPMPRGCQSAATCGTTYQHHGLDTRDQAFQAANEVRAVSADSQSNTTNSASDETAVPYGVLLRSGWNYRVLSVEQHGQAV